MNNTFFKPTNTTNILLESFFFLFPFCILFPEPHVEDIQHFPLGVKLQKDKNECEDFVAEIGVLLITPPMWQNKQHCQKYGC